jgi:hypothetical protein
MSNDFKKVLVKDDRLMVTDSLNYAVVKSGQNVTNVRFPAISTNVNSLNFVIPFPSESTVLDREVYLKTTTQYLLKFNGNLNGSEIFSNDPNSGDNPAQFVVGYQCPLIYGYNISVGSFSSQRTMDTIQVQLNNNVNTINVSDVLPALLRCADAIDWEKENMTASGVDRLARPLDETVLVTNSNLSGYEDCHGGKFVGNGGFQAVLTALTSATPFNADGSPNPYNYGTVGGTDPVPGNVGTDTFLLTITSTEPLVAPPFIWNKTMSNRQGLYGLQNAQIVCNYGNPAKAIKLASGSCIADPNSLGTSGQNFQYSNALRDVFQTWPVGADANSPLVTVTRNAVVNAELQMKYITPHGNDIVPVRNVIPLLEFPRFITTGLGSIPLALNTAYAVNTEGDTIQNFTQNQIIPTTAVLASQTYTFNQIPDKLLIFVRPDQVYRNSSTYNDWVFAIKNIVIQWNNHAGILANASQEQLFHMSKESGSNQDFLAFKGVSNVVKDKQSGPMSFNFMALGVNSGTSTAPALGIQNRAVFPSPGQATTVGSYLMLDLAKHLELGESFNAPGSLGSFQLQFNVTIENYITSTIGGIENDTQQLELNGITPEIVVIPVNSGLMVTERGQTSCYTGILTKSDVLDASLQEPYGHMELKRIVGHGQGDSSKALPSRIRPKPKQGKHVMPNGSIMDNRLM